MIPAILDPGQGALEPHQLPRQRKVYAYVMRGSELLVFRQPDSPEAGIQVPGGTVEPGEPLAQAVIRETLEETGLQRLTLRRYLGSRRQDMRPWGAARLDVRHFYQLSLEGPAPERWRHLERHRSDGIEEPIVFDLQWVEIGRAPELIAGMGALLGRLASGAES